MFASNDPKDNKTSIYPGAEEQRCCRNETSRLILSRLRGARVKTKTCSRGLRVLHATPRPMVGKNDFNRNLRKKSRRSSHAGRAVRLPR